MYLTAKGSVIGESGAWTNLKVTGWAGIVRLGTAQNDYFESFWGDTLTGGRGDDTYNLLDPKSRIDERAGEGIDTAYVRYWGGIALPDNVENVYLISKGATWATGNALANLIVAGTAGATLDGGAGDDVLVGGSGADIFRIVAGNGSDAIVNFRAGWDSIKLDGYGIKSFAQLKALSTQVGSDVSVKLSATETLVIRDVQLDKLGAADFNLPLATVTANIVTHTLDKVTGWNANGWYVLNNVWNPGNLVLGKDYTINSSFNVKDMTGGTTFNWSFPQVTEAFATIRAYPEVIFGQSPLNTSNTNPTDTHVFPAKVSDLVALTTDHNVEFAGNTGGFNVAYDIWLSNSATAVGKSAVSNEIMVWVHTGAFPPSGDLVGTYSKDGFTAKIYHTGTYTAVVADKDMPVGKIDVADLLAALTKLGIVSPTEYVRAVELGAEVVSGAGSLKINNLDVTLVTGDGQGGTITKVASGDGTTETRQAKPILVAPATPGVETIIDAQGHVAGTKTTVLGDDGRLTVTRTDLVGQVTGSDIVTKAANGVTTQHYSAGGALLGSERATDGADGSTSVMRFDAAGKLLGADKLSVEPKGVVRTEHFDATWTMIGVDRKSVGADGVTSIQHFNGKGVLLGTDKITTAAKAVTVEHYDAAYKITAIDKTTTAADGSVSVQHYDGAWKLQSAELFKYPAPGATTVYHYDGKYALTGVDIATTASDGIVKTVHYDGAYKMLTTSLDGTGRGDVMSGGTGATEFHGGLGSDTMKAGSGPDTFVFDTAIGQGDVDTIAGFHAAKDKIVLDHQVFAALGAPGALAAGMFAGNGKAADANDHIIYDKVTGNLFYDADGAGGHAAVLFAHLDPGLALTGDNFVIA